jgi:hypothetical protein
MELTLFNFRNHSSTIFIQFQENLVIHSKRFADTKATNLGKKVYEGEQCTVAGCQNVTL